MTIDEAIKYTKEIAVEQDKPYKQYNNTTHLISAKSCKEYAEAYKQLARWLEELKALKEQASDDCISRKAVIDALKQQADEMSNWAERYAEQRKGILTAINIASDCPSVTPQSKTGHWIHDGGYWKNRWICSECGYKLFDVQTRFCPECGTRMEVEK